MLNNLKKEKKMTNIVDMTSVTEGDTFSLKESGIELNENKFDIESIGDPENPSKFEITDTKTGKVFTVNADALTGGDYHQVIRHTDGTIPKEDIKRYYENAVEKFNTSKDNQDPYIRSLIKMMLHNLGLLTNTYYKIYK